MEPAKEKLVLENTALAGIIIKQFGGSGIEWEELQSLCYMGLVKAALAYDESRGLKFGTLAGVIMRREIMMAIRTRTRHPDHLQASLEAPVKSTEDGYLTLADVQSCEEDGYDRIEEKTLLQSIQSSGDLKENEKKVLLLWLNGKNQREIGKKAGLSQSYVSRIVKKSAQKLYAENYL